MVYGKIISRLNNRYLLFQYHAKIHTLEAVYMANYDQEDVFMQAEIQYALKTINAGLIINGGAAVAVLTILGSFVEAKVPINEYFIWSLRFFALGVFSSAISSGCSYVSQYYYHLVYVELKGRKTADYWRYGALVAIAIGFISFIIGVGFASNAFSLVKI